MTELPLAGPLPADVQQTTVSSIGVFSASKEPAAARAFIEFLTSADAARVLRDKGHEPLA